MENLKKIFIIFFLCSVASFGYRSINALPFHNAYFYQNHANRDCFYKPSNIIVNSWYKDIYLRQYIGSRISYRETVTKIDSLETKEVFIFLGTESYFLNKQDRSLTNLYLAGQLFYSFFHEKTLESSKISDLVFNHIDTVDNDFFKKNLFFTPSKNITKTSSATLTQGVNDFFMNQKGNIVLVQAGELVYPIIKYNNFYCLININKSHVAHMIFEGYKYTNLIFSKNIDNLLLLLNDFLENAVNLKLFSGKLQDLKYYGLSIPYSEKNLFYWLSEFIDNKYKNRRLSTLDVEDIFFNKIKEIGIREDELNFNKDLLISSLVNFNSLKINKLQYLNYYDLLRLIDDFVSYNSTWKDHLVWCSDTHILKKEAYKLFFDKKNLCKLHDKSLLYLRKIYQTLLEML